MGIDWINRQECAVFLGVSARTFDRIIAGANPPACVLIGKRRRWTIAALVAYAERQTTSKDVVIRGNVPELVVEDSSPSVPQFSWAA